MNTTTETQKYTPGPWHFTDQIESKGQSIYTVGYTDETGERTHDVRFIPPVSDWKTAHANAKLIAASPDLLEACKMVERAWTGDGVGMSAAVDLCLLAIAKATK